MIWMRLLANNKRLYIFQASALVFLYPGVELPMVKMPIRSNIKLPQGFILIESLEHSVFSIGGYILVEEKKQPVAHVYEYIERKGRLEPRERMTEERFNCYAVAKQNEIYVFGGENAEKRLLHSEKYVISDNAWISITFLLKPIIKGCLYSIQNYIYHIEPNTDNSLSLATYDCIDDKWAEEISIKCPLISNSLIFCERGLNDDEVVVFGNDSLLILNVKDKNIKFDKEKMSYECTVEERTWSHVRIENTIFGINEKSFVKYQEDERVKAIASYDLKELIKTIEYKKE